MEVQKKTCEEFKNEGSNKIVMETSSATSEPLNVQIPYDSLFDDLENDIIFASSYSSETGSKELLIQQQAESVEQAEFLSGLVSISARKTHKGNNMNLISEIEVKDLHSTIKLDIPLTGEVKENEGVLRCMFLNERTN